MTTQMITQANPSNEQAGYKVDVSRGRRVGRVSSEWFSRPDDERYLSLADLHEAVSTGPSAAAHAPWTVRRSVSKQAATMPSGWR